MNHRSRLFSAVCLFLGFLAFRFVSADSVIYEKPVVHKVYRRHGERFTQGFFIENDRLYESSGLYGRSFISVSVRSADGEYGFLEIRRSALDETYFAEGIAFALGRIYQLTWKKGIVFVRDPENLKVLKSFDYKGEGWGLAYDGTYLIRSDGTARLFYHDPRDFSLKKSVVVTLEGEPLDKLNELEYRDGLIYANLWQKGWIACIGADGKTVKMIDARSLIRREKPRREGAVLNGLAYSDEEDLWYLTGKYWKHIYVCKFLPDR